MLHHKPFCKMDETTRYHMICALIGDIKDDLNAPLDFCFYEYDHSLSSYRICWKGKANIHHKLIPIATTDPWVIIERNIRDSIFDTEDLEVE